MRCYNGKLFYAITLGVGEASLGILCAVIVRRRVAKTVQKKRNLLSVKWSETDVLAQHNEVKGGGVVAVWKRLRRRNVRLGKEMVVLQGGRTDAVLEINNLIKA